VTVTGTGLSTVTGASGTFTIAGVPTGSRTLQVSLSGFIIHTLPVQVASGSNPPIVTSLSPVLVAGEIRIVLNWGAEPTDIDAHITGPKCGTVERFHVFHQDRNPVPYASLNVDDATSFGPESITISRLNGELVEGEYDYWVHNHSGSPQFGASNAIVTVYRGSSQTAQFPVNAEPGVSTTTLRIWRAVNLFVNAAGNVTVDRTQAGFWTDTQGSQTVLPTIVAPAPAVCGTSATASAVTRGLSDPQDIAIGITVAGALAGGRTPRSRIVTLAV